MSRPFINDGIAHGSGPQGQAPVAAPRPRRAFLTAACLLILAAAVATAFFPALEAGFVNWDDDKLIVGNGAFRGFSWAHLSWMLSTRMGGHWQPLTWLSYAVDDGLVRGGVWSLEAFSMHLTNVVLHVISALLFFFVARRLIAESLWPSADHSNATAASLTAHAALSLGAMVAALTFAVHPLRAESVAWVTERRDVLCMALLQATTLCYLAWVRRPRAIMRAMTIATFLLALLAKASAVTWPVVLLILDVYPLRRMRTATNTLGERPGRLALEKLPLWLASAAAGVMAWRAQVDTNAAYTLREYPLHLRFAQAAEGLVFYVTRTLLPIGLGPLIQIPPASVLFGPRFLGNVAAVGVASVMVWRWRRRWPFLAAAAGIYVVNLLPVLGFFQSGPQLVADRYSYFSCLPWAVIAGGCVAWATGRAARALAGASPAQLQGSSLSTDTTPRASSRRRAALPFALALVATAIALVALHRMTWAQCRYWDDSLSLWTRAVQTCPSSSVAHVQYGCALGDTAAGLGDDGAMRDATDHFRRATQLDPTDAIAWHYLGRGLLRLEPTVAGLREAESALKRAIALAPARAAAYGDLAGVYEQIVLISTDGDWLRWRLAATDALRAGARACPNDADLAFRLAQRLLNHHDERVRDAVEGLTWAERADRLYGQKNIPARLVHSAALAANARDDEARAIARDAYDLAMRLRQDQLAAEAMRQLRALQGDATPAVTP